MTLAPMQGFTLFVLLTVAGTACERKPQTCLALELTESEVGLVLLRAQLCCWNSVVKMVLT